MNFLAIYQITPTEKFPDLSWRVYEVPLCGRMTYGYSFFNGDVQHGSELCHADLGEAKARASQLAADHRKWPPGPGSTRPARCGLRPRRRPNESGKGSEIHDQKNAATAS